MKKLYNISQTAKLSETTVATLHYYDKIDLLKPFKVDKNTGYRYYSDEEIIYLKVINFYKHKNISLDKIKEILSENSFDYLIDFLDQNEKEIDSEIKKLKTMKKEITSLKNQYLKYRSNCYLPLSNNTFYRKKINKRAIIKIESLKTPSLENFNNIINLAYDKIDENTRNQFEFYNSVNILDTQTDSCFFVNCKKYPIDSKLISFIPKGEYIYAYCSIDDLDSTINNLKKYILDKHNIDANHIIKSVLFTGLFTWIYEVQIYIA